MEQMSHPAAGLMHIGIPCNNYKASVEFYRRLGFKPIWKPSDRAGFFQAGDCVIELYQFDGPSKPREAGPVNHFALKSEDIDASFQDVTAMGLTVLSQGIESNDMCAPKSNRYFIIQGPDGERVEFAQIK